MSVAVNVSAVQFRQENFGEVIKKVLRETGLPPQHLGTGTNGKSLTYECRPDVSSHSVLGKRLAQCTLRACAYFTWNGTE